MALIIRLRQQGRKNRQTYRMVVAAKTAPRDGKYLDMLGWNDPLAEKDLHLEEEKIKKWLENGAQITEKAESIVRRYSPVIMQEYYQKKQEKKIRLRKRRKTSAQQSSTPSE